MRLTPRDVRLVKDIALSHVLSRDQVIRLGYFRTVTRANSRLRDLRKARLLRTLDSTFFGQTLYCVGTHAKEQVGERIERILLSRATSPRFVQHALCLTNVRLELCARGSNAWRFEQQLRTSFEHRGRRFEVRPDGLAVFPDHIVAVEADLGHVAPSKFAEKLIALDQFVASGECQKAWGSSDLKLLTVTTGPLRARHLSRRTPASCSYDHLCQTHHDLGIPWAGAWS